MSKRDSLKFTVKQSLVVGTATATLAAGGCTVNPGPGDFPDTGDAVSPDGEAGDAGISDTGESGDTSEGDASDANSSNDGG